MTTSTPTMAPNAQYQWSCLSIQGKDSRQFLQGQLSNDLELITPEHGGFFALCTPKGRTLANFFIVQQPGSDSNSLLLVVPSSTAEVVLSTLAKYIVFSKAELQPSTEWQARIVQLNTGFPFEELNLAKPAPDSFASSQSGECGLLRLGASCGVLVHKAEAELSSEQFNMNANDSELALIREGLGLVQEHNSDEFVPQMLNMQLNQGISFTKGCYTGQEIVARAQYRGKIKRRMYRATCSGDENSISAGQDVTDKSSGKSVGAVLSVAHTAQQALEMLVVLSLKDDTEQSLVIGEADLKLLSLPYDSPNDAENDEADGASS